MWNHENPYMPTYILSWFRSIADMTEKKKKAVEIQHSSITLDKGFFQSGRMNFAVSQF